jgi:hypothetical protein
MPPAAAAMMGRVDMNERIRARAGRPQVRPAPAPEPEPQPQPVDYGAGPRALAPDAGADAMNRWLRGRYKRHRQQPVTVEARRKP